VFESRVLRRISGTRTGELNGAWRTLHNEQFLFPTIDGMSMSRRTR
jgi:hypothetical protein